MKTIIIILLLLFTTAAWAGVIMSGVRASGVNFNFVGSAPEAPTANTVITNLGNTVVTSSGNAVVTGG